ncbi:MAG: hypothetical protein Q8K85_06070 [Hyphomicrobium sp.]|nr:hypothetical protein [Hyphomicrobium sp.]
MLAGVVGAFVGATVLAVALGILFTKIGSTFEGAAAMGGATAGSIGGAAIGFALSVWLVLRRGGQNAGATFAWIAMAGLATTALIALVALSY